MAYPLALAMLAPADAPTAVFASTPLVGLGVLRALKRLERQDIALVVFGDFPLAELMTPPTTVVDQRPTALAHAAFDHLARRLDAQPRPWSRPSCPPASCSAGPASCRPGRLVVRHPARRRPRIRPRHDRHQADGPAPRTAPGSSTSPSPRSWDELGDGCAERDPRVVVAAVEELLARAASTVGGGNGHHGPLSIRSIGFTSMAEAGVLVDADGETRSPVIAWFDPRGSRSGLGR